MKKRPAYHKPYDQEYKRQAVELLLSSGKPCEQLARELGCSGYSLHLWKKHYLASMGPTTVDGQSMSPQEMERELRALRKQVHHLEQQRAILKKALSILGEEPNPGMR